MNLNVMLTHSATSSLERIWADLSDLFSGFLLLTTNIQLFIFWPSSRIIFNFQVTKRKEKEHLVLDLSWAHLLLLVLISGRNGSERRSDAAALIFTCQSNYSRGNTATSPEVLLDSSHYVSSSFSCVLSSYLYLILPYDDIFLWYVNVIAAQTNIK